jgi:integrase
MGVYDLWHKSRPKSGEPRCKEHDLAPSKIHGTGLRWQVRWDVYVNGERRQEKRNFALKVGKDPERHADAFDKVAGNQSAPKVVEDLNLTVREVAAMFFETYIADPGTIHRLFLSLEDRVFPLLGDIPVWDIYEDPEIVQRWMKGLTDDGLRPNTIIRYKANLSQILKYASDKKIIPANPVNDPLVTRVRRSRREVVPFTDQQVKDIESHLPSDLSPIVWIGSELGLRFGEICALSPVDRSGNYIHVQRQLKQVPGGRVFALPKRGKTRMVPLPSTTARKLDALEIVSITLPWGKLDGPPKTVELYLHTNRTHAVHRGTAVIWWYRALKAAGIPHAPYEDVFHKLRHTYASKLLSRGVDIRRLSACLGHRNVVFTLETYTHLMPDGMDSVRRVFDDVP